MCIGCQGMEVRNVMLRTANAGALRIEGGANNSMRAASIASFRTLKLSMGSITL